MNEYSETGEFHRDFQAVMRATIELIYSQLLQSEHQSVDDLNLLDNLFIIFTIKTSIQWDPQSPINFNKFYQDRRQADDQFMLKRVQKAYDYIKQQA